MTPLLETIAAFILNCEARRTSDGHLMVYPLPAGDGGGEIEVAGICDRYDHDVCHQLRGLIEQGQYDEAEQIALAYYISNTDGVKGMLLSLLQPSPGLIPALEAFARDTWFNRGGGGVAHIFQIALQITPDGKWGPQSRRALAAVNNETEAPELIRRLRSACEAYERIIAPPVGARAKFWNGLVNRWDKRTAFARTLLGQPSTPPIA